MFKYILPFGLDFSVSTNPLCLCHAVQFKSIIYMDSWDPSTQRIRNLCLWTNIGIQIIDWSYNTGGNDKICIQMLKRHDHKTSRSVDNYIRNHTFSFAFLKMRKIYICIYNNNKRSAPWVYLKTSGLCCQALYSEQSRALCLDNYHLFDFQHFVKRWKDCFQHVFWVIAMFEYSNK